MCIHTQCHTCRNTSNVTTQEYTQVWTFTCAGGTSNGFIYDFVYGHEWKFLYVNQRIVCGEASNSSNQFLGGVYTDSPLSTWQVLCNSLPDGWTFFPFHENCRNATMAMNFLNHAISLLSLPIHKFVRSISASVDFFSS